MRKFVALVFAITASLLAPSTAFSSETTQNHLRCFEKYISGADREVVIRWMITTIATHSSLSEIVNISTTQLHNAGIGVAELFTDPLTRRYKVEFRAAFLDPENKGTNPTETAFRRLGEMTMLYIMGNKRFTKICKASLAF